MVMIMVMMVFVLVSIVPVSIAVPVVIMLDPAVLTFPVAAVVLSALIMWSLPIGALIWCARPVTLMPSPVVSNGVPIAINPLVARSRAGRNNTNYRWRRRRTDPDTKGNLTGKNGPPNQGGRRE